MQVSRFAFVAAVVLVFQTRHAQGLLGPSSFILQPVLQPIIPLLDLVPLNLTAPIKKLLVSVDLANYPHLESSIAKYNSYTRETRPKCCGPDQFPDLFTFLYDFFIALKDLGKESFALLCDLLKLLTPLSCKKNFNQNQDSNDIQSLGCAVDAIFGPLFGKLGILLARVIVGGLGPLDSLDGCLLSGVAEVFNNAAYKKRKCGLGDVIGPISAVRTILGFIFSTMSCLGEPLTPFIEDSYVWSCERILKICENQRQGALW